jgi:hypothetical protein
VAENLMKMADEKINQIMQQLNKGNQDANTKYVVE